MSTVVPTEYKSSLNLIETEIAIKSVKDYFEKRLAEMINLTRVSAPVFVKSGKGINDNLNGVERIVSFDAKEIEDNTLEVVQSLAKWKRMALYRYGFREGEGLYTDMNAIRRDEELDNLHSIYVDQWDWEKIISKKDRTFESLFVIVNQIYQVFKDTENYLYSIYPIFEKVLPQDIYFITTQELEDKYPELTPKEREDVIAKEKGAVFIMQIGGQLRSGQKHDGRSPDYDDWTLNGDIVFYYPLLDRAFEVSSMGIRVDEETLEKQLKLSGCEERKNLEYHKAVLEKKLPYTMGGGIGQSRICMFFLRKAHIGEVQSSVWTDEIIAECEANNIFLL
ncbi:aspartate--ammonia ligase [Clostridium sp. YIM B02515]|uniref:Aspartate--ammonia ligase n=1 Tax=Clostridium rhizosphaerae TaxID=2803861 RepID=A0ABS1TCK5_9CLOT|nr:aspartate--ammonia ligase [Clostridium rhizosphaerae]MBL4936502.1 aspartate--ammonia ligase [Clostridium rhizosphaerae]